MPESKSSGSSEVKKEIVVSVKVSLDPAETASKNKQQRVNWFHLVFSVSACIVAGLSLCLYPSSQPSIDAHLLGAVVVVFFVDLYLILLLKAVIRKCRIASPEIFPFIHERGFSVFILCFQLLALILAFARFNRIAGLEGASTNGDAFYDAFVTAVTLNHGHYNPCGFWPHIAVVAELLTILLLLIVFFPLLVSRLSMFAEETATPPPPPSVTLSAPEGDIKVVWDLYNAGATSADRKTGEYKLRVNEKGKIEPV